MSLKELKVKLQQNINLSPQYGTIKKISSSIVYADGITPSVGDIVRIKRADDFESLGMVTVSEDDKFAFTPFSFIEGYKTGDKVLLEKSGLMFPVGEGVLGRVLDPLGNPMDDKGALENISFAPTITPPIRAMKRGIINEVFSVGVKSIDGLLTCGKGQKMGIFAGSGVGKSTLMGMIVKGCSAPIKVIALIGERGREVPEFIQKNLNGDLSNTVLIVATSDDSALMRKYGAFSAMAVAEYFKNEGKDVLFMMDSVTRFAMAQREIGLAQGEPPTSKGYPPSVLSLLPQLMERAGKEDGKGSITAFFTVLVEGDDLSDPIADQTRSILDGHIVLNREMTDYGVFPPVGILNSASRLSNEIVSPEHKEAARKFRRLYALLKENEILIRIGSYQKGNDSELDEAIDKKSAMEDFLKQNESEKIPYKESVERLINMM
ncbi:flagellar protein export ATPase FliI [Helicobacter cappadocius]|uniref:Flagellar protein export ATPase FliI n=1 Tax=Helicobacter cappadocius TaxID=3063998 RepID=A0AA90Q2E7_9HELI|nr:MULTISPECIES: flagellar protein export ATPase FliI [unclassified Helicobacter]MDO7252875.1 flagellar protein export ATPase FliI [Helicobacter sp. faydin-H75]MDP2538918.1 flagellar protein export ATPase FliI [Helicobacter sp. faydin-H76]